MLVYLYDISKDNLLIGQYKCQKNPISGGYLKPYNSTEKIPLSPYKDYTINFNKALDEWVYMSGGNIVREENKIKTTINNKKKRRKKNG